MEMYFVTTGECESWDVTNTRVLGKHVAGDHLGEIGCFPDLCPFRTATGVCDSAPFTVCVCARTHTRASTSLSHSLAGCLPQALYRCALSQPSTCDP